MATGTRTRHLLRLGDLRVTELEQLLDLAARMKEHPYGWVHSLEGDVLVSIYDKPSTRTRISFATAASRLGMEDQIIRPDELQLGRGETIADTARTLSSYAAAVTIRTFAQAKVDELAEHSTIPIVNALTDDHHPCQLLADLLTIREQHDTLDGIKVAFVGDGNNVFHSLALLGATLGIEVRLAHPAGYAPNPRIVERAQALAAKSGGKLVFARDPAEIVAGASVVYTDAWTSMGQEAETEERRDAFAAYQLNAALLAIAGSDAIVMHCLPAHRGEEITSDVMDGPQSVIFEQSENRLHVQKALLVQLIGAPGIAEQPAASQP